MQVQHLIRTSNNSPKPCLHLILCNTEVSYNNLSRKVNSFLVVHLSTFCNSYGWHLSRHTVPNVEIWEDMRLKEKGINTHPNRVSPSLWLCWLMLMLAVDKALQANIWTHEWFEVPTCRKVSRLHKILSWNLHVCPSDAQMHTLTT